MNPETLKLARRQDEEELSYKADYDFYRWLYSLPVIYERDQIIRRKYGVSAGT